MKVKVFSTKICPYCVSLKQYLEEHNIEFEEIDVSENREMAQYIIDKTGQMGVPVTEIDDQVILGFDREKIAKLLDIHD